MVEPGWSPITIRRMRIARWIITATNTHTGYVILIVFHCNNGCTMATEYYVMRTSSRVNNNATNNSRINPRCCSTRLRLADISEGTSF
jgi:hypothetical protein